MTTHKIRIWTYATVGVLLVVLYLVLKGSSWRGSTDLHTVYEVIASLLALFVGAIALVRFYARPENTYLFVGAAFLVTALLDGYHAVITSSRFADAFPSAPHALIPWSGTASRLLLSVLMGCSYLAWRQEQKLGTEGRINSTSVYLTLAGVTLASFCFLAFAPLPPAYFPDLLFGRPDAFYPAVFFLAALVGYLSKGAWREDDFESSLVLSLILGLFTQTLFMSRSHELFDAMFDMAHLLKILSYAIVMAGLLGNIYRLHRQFYRTNTSLETEIEERRTAEERFALAVKGTSDGIWDWNLVTNEMWLAPRFKELLGYKDHELHSSFASWEAHLHPKDRAHTMECLRLHLQEGKPYVVDYRLRTKSSDYRWFRARGIAERDEDDTPVRMAGAIQDITQSKLNETKLRDYASQMEAKSAELERARQSAEQSTRAKSEFLANMSHEIRTPMTAILGFTEVLAETVSSPDTKEAVSTIMANGNHLLDIINDILDLSKIEAGKLRVDRRKIPTVEIVHRVVELMRGRAQNKALPLEIDFASLLPETVQTDPTRLRQILLNLLSNAIKFTDRGSVRLFVHFSEAGGQGKAEPMLCFSIVDSGIGMTADQLDKLFQPFTQADASTSRRFGGTGLGLSISKQLAQLLGGDIGVSSRPGVGSVFRLAVPVGPLAGIKMVDPHDWHDKTRKPRDHTITEIPSDLNCRILLAEDVPANQRLITHILERAGAEVCVVENGNLAVLRALEALEAGAPFDLILMDMQMPIMDGYEATEMLRRKKYDRPIVALTANAMAADRDKCLDAGCDDFATKPVNRHSLLEVIREQVDKR
ncbi:MAG: ATP-binding protein [Planctomycetota bacterium]